MNAVGSTSVQYFRNLDKIVTLMPINIMTMPWCNLKEYVEKDQTTAVKKQKDRKFLEALASDKKYLEGMLDKLSIPPGGFGSTKKKGFNKPVTYTNPATKCIVKEVKTALDFLEDRRDFWSQQKPDYPAGSQERA